MLRNLDLTTWQGLLSTLGALALITLIGVGIRLLVMLTIQQRRERMNRQINERLRTLIAAYKTLGGSFTGELAVDPRHLREIRRAAVAEEGDDLSADPAEGSDRGRRIRDAVEAALSDIILLGTEEQVRLAARAAAELVEGRAVQVHELVMSLRAFIRGALDLAPIPADLAIPLQGPTRPSSSGGRARGGGEGGARQGGGRGGGGGMGGGMGMGAGMGVGMMAGGRARGEDDPGDPPPG